MVPIIATYPKRKLETTIQVKAPAHKLYNAFAKQCIHHADYSPNLTKSAEICEGDWETNGSVMLWNYVIDGKTGTFKERTELDDEHMIVKPATPKGEGSLASVAIAYEKLREDVPAPDHYLEYMIELAKKISESLVKA
ncbi:MLP-like protein 28 [Tripterygium wilfordii]|uniref:MLP-like protein 28 n=1 Tax=Tripterygium wilfordii TaxID=458696 RepID=A0A7J7DFV5_TRIWF|nr:MLP-like protein 28 [Tripterygium wilfordii]